MRLTLLDGTPTRAPLTRHAWSLCPMLLWGLGACGATSTPTRPGERVAAAPAASASQMPAAIPAASSSASPAPAVSSASVQPPEVKRLPPATKEQLRGKCSLGAPIAIGKSTVSDVSGPEVAIAASSEGVVASWSSSDDEVTTSALDDSGQPRGEGRAMASEATPLVPALWELGDGKFVLAFAIKQPPLPPLRAPRLALQRVDASGELVGSPVPFALDHIEAVTTFKNQLLMLTTSLHKREILRVAATEGGLEVKRAALPENPGDLPTRELLLPTSNGAAWIISEYLDGVTTIEREEGKSVKVTLPSDFRRRPVLSEDDEPLWLACWATPTVRGLQLHAGKLMAVELPRRVCDGPAVWSVSSDTSLYDNKNRGLLFTPSPLEAGLHLSKEPRQYWNVDATWTGTRVLAIYATGKRRDWTVVARPITCEGSAAPPAPSAPASAPSSATEAPRTKD